MEKPLIILIQPSIVEISNAGINSLLDRFSDKSDGLRGKYPIKKMENWFEIANCLVQQRKKLLFFPRPGKGRVVRSPWWAGNLLWGCSEAKDPWLLHANS